MFANARNINIQGGQFITHSFSLQSLVSHGNVVPSAFHDSERGSARCHPHTREFVLTEIMEWLEDPTDGTQILWMYGYAGGGKTTIAHTIAEMCTRAGKSVASFFFSRTVAGRDTGEKLVPSLAYQFSLSIPEIQESVAKTLEDDPLLPSRTINNQAQNLIIQPLNKYFMNTSRHEDRDRIVILDGLDECRSVEDQRNILEMLSNIAVELSSPGLSFLVVSRPEKAIRAAFAKEPLKSLTYALALDHSGDPDSDIRTFLQAQFDDIKRNHPGKGGLPPTWPSEQEIEWLVEKSSGQFIYASTVAKFVGSLRHNPQNRLDIVLGKASQSSARPFEELDDMYRHLFSSTIHVEEILNILALLLLCKSLSSQLSIVDEFLSYTPGSTRTLLSGLRSLLLLPFESPEDKGIDGMIKIAHSSLSDFLLDRERSAEFFIDPNLSRSKITRRLLQILLTEGHSKVLKDACEAALPEVLEDLYEIDLPQFVVPMSPSNLNSTRLEDWGSVAKFFLWMEHQIHPNRERNLFHHHLPAVNKWMHDLIDRLRPHSPVTEVKSMTLLSLPKVDSGKIVRGRSQEIDVLLTIAELKAGEVHSRPARTELSFHMYTSLRSTPFDALLHKFIAARSSGAEYPLTGEKCARLARTLWMYVLPYKVRESLMDKRFGPPYPAPLAFHSFNGLETPSEEELSLLLLPKILPKVPEAGTKTLIEFLRIVRDHPLLKYFPPTNELYWLHKEVSDVAEQYLTSDLFKRLGLEESSEPESKKYSARKSKD